MSLREALGLFQERALMRGGALPAKPAILVAASEIAQTHGEGGGRPPAENLEERAIRLSRKVRDGHELTSKDLKDAAWCLWNIENALADHSEFLTNYLEAVANNQRRTVLRALCAAYLNAFSKDLPRLSPVAKVLQKAVLNHQWQYADLQRSHRIFDPEWGVSSVAEACIEQSVAPHDLLAELGLKGLPKTAGFTQEVYRVVVPKLAAGLSGQDAHSIFDKIVSWSETADGKLVHPDCRPDLAEAITGPFANAAPDKELQKRMLNFLLEHLRDPRVFSARWSRMESAAHIVRRWLTEVSFKQFFEVVDKIAKPEQWNYRRKFWEAYFDEGFITEAWVAFSPHGSQVARADYGKNVGFGELTRGGGANISPGHAVLLMKMGRVTVADWSENGKCYIWEPNEDGAPELYRPEYSRADVQRKRHQEGIMHGQSRRYGWQNKVSDRLRKLIKGAPDPSAYRVR